MVRPRSVRSLSLLIVFLSVLMVTSILHAATAAACDEIATTIPANLKVPEALRTLLEEVMRRSPTFRHQVQELRHAPHVKMAISYGDVSNWHLLRAESTVLRYEWGALQVDTRLYTARDVIEVVAHELEHVCEQIEGLDVRALSHRRNSGVYAVAGGRHFETQRAIVIGRQVAREALGLSAGAALPSRATE